MYLRYTINIISINIAIVKLPSFQTLYFQCRLVPIYIAKDILLIAPCYLTKKYPAGKIDYSIQSTIQGFNYSGIPDLDLAIIKVNTKTN